MNCFNPVNLIVENTERVGYTDLRMVTEASNHSYLNETYNYIHELNKEFNAANRAFYRSILESGDNEILIRESFSDFMDSFRKIISKFLAFIKSIFERFVTGLNKFVQAEGYLKKHKKDFDKFSTENEFYFQGYEYTFSSNIPVISALADFSNDFVFKLNGEQIKFTTTEEIKKAYQTLTAELESENWYDSFRARVLGDEGGSIGRSEFAEELFSTYRNGESDKDEIRVDNYYVSTAYMSFENHSKAISEVKKTKTSIDDSYNSIRKQVEKMMSISRNDGQVTGALTISPNGVKAPLTGESVTQMDLYIKAKVNQVQEMSNIHAMAFAAKLDAYNDLFKQNKAVLYKALSKIQGTIPKEV